MSFESDHAENRWQATIMGNVLDLLTEIRDNTKRPTEEEQQAVYNNAELDRLTALVLSWRGMLQGVKAFDDKGEMTPPYRVILEMEEWLHSGPA